MGGIVLLKIYRCKPLAVSNNRGKSLVSKGAPPVATEILGDMAHWKGI
jgi:hypothetical protein